MDAKTQKSLDQMRSFIIQEAKEKSTEIASKAEEDYFVEKNSQVEVEKDKIRKEYERKESQISVKRRIEMSNRTNAILLDVQKQRNKILLNILDKAKISADAKTRNADNYKKLLINLISQGLVQLMEENVVVICRKDDKQIVSSVLNDAVAQAKKLAEPKQLNVKITVDDTEFLPPAPSNSNEGESCCGGIVLACNGGRIRLNNTLDARLQIAYEEQLPTLKKLLFKDKLQEIF
ncbi:putative V-type proton ATPase subunit E [Blattamonas nauphoetae]|uniref:V-type proton ATPase subunit E n=1 Tax=Blattamonas nauphoetae TaxID=2049346 RepID=A0ABQ9XDC5_9EUKA|nr:putative V-type proton ATPase subunit E [Blattamonas nauphoetae]